MKKKFYFLASNFGDEICAIEEITVDLDKIDDTNGDYLPQSSFTCKTVVNFDPDFDQLHPGSYSQSPYKQVITDYDPHWMIAVVVFDDIEYSVRKSLSHHWRYGGSSISPIIN